MPRTVAIAAIVVACCSLTLSGQEPVRLDTVLTLKSGAEIRGQFVGFRDGLFTLRLPDGRIVIHSVGDVSRMQPIAEAPASAPGAAMPATPATPAPARAAAPAPAPAAPAAAPAAAAAPDAALEARACGPAGARFPTVTDKSQHPTPGAPADKALVYVVRPTTAGSRIQTKLAVDGTWMGANYGNNYFFLTLDPGEHAFCSQADDRAVLSLTVQAGRIYYLQQSITTGMMRSRTFLQILSDQDGPNSLAELNLSTPRPPR